MLYQKIQLIIDYINNKETFNKDENFDINQLITLCKYHSLLPILYKACVKYQIKLDDKQKKYLAKEYQKAVYQEATQEMEKEIILSNLTENKIKCMPLKGSIIKYLYPSPELRTMSDIDILFENKKTKEVKKILIDLGYKCLKSGGTDDEYQKPPFMNVEMHRIMVDGNFELIANYYQNIWDVMKPTKENQYLYEISKEDFYIHMVAHVARHYAVGGIGIRFVIDEWLYLKNYQNILNWDYINSEFQKINLLKFAENFKQLTIKWFEGKTTSSLEEDMTEYIYNSGTYGSTRNEQSVKLVLGKDGMSNFKSSKIRYIFKMLFPGFKYMANRNHILKKLPFLLPYFYLQRIFVALFKKRSLAIHSIEGLDKYNEDYSNKVKELHNNSGM